MLRPLRRMLSNSPGLRITRERPQRCWPLPASFGQSRPNGSRETLSDYWQPPGGLWLVGWPAISDDRVSLLQECRPDKAIDAGVGASAAFAGLGSPALQDSQQTGKSHP